MKRKLLIQCISIGLAGCLSFAGCADKNVNYDIDGATEAGRFQRGKTGVKQFAGAEAWTDEWTVKTSKGNTAVISIDADIIVPTAEQMSVLEVKETGYDKKYKKSMVKQVFDDEEVYYNDISHMTRKELAELRAECKLLYKANSWDLANLQLKEKMKECDAALKEAKDTYTLAEDFSMNEYWGKRAGIPYKLSFMEDQRFTEESMVISRRNKSMIISPKDVYQVCPQKFRETENLTYEAWDWELHGIMTENLCKLSEEEAKKEAQSFVDDLELGDLAYAYSEFLVWGDKVKESEWTAEGYVLYFGFGIDDMAFMEYGTEEDYWNFNTKRKETEASQYSLNARVAVHVTDAGVIGAKVFNPVEAISVSKGVELLALEDIQGIIKEQLTNHMGFFRFTFPMSGNTIELNEMELIYFRMRDGKKLGCYSYVPAWRLAYVLRDGSRRVDSIQNQVLINAIDGSMIDFFEET
jgi:hypothetical protein